MEHSERGCDILILWRGTRGWGLFARIGTGSAPISFLNAKKVDEVDGDDKVGATLLLVVGFKKFQQFNKILITRRKNK